MRLARRPSCHAAAMDLGSLCSSVCTLQRNNTMHRLAGSAVVASLSPTSRSASRPDVHHWNPEAAMLKCGGVTSPCFRPLHTIKEPQAAMWLGLLTLWRQARRAARSGGTWAAPRQSALAPPPPASSLRRRARGTAASARSSVA
jgi:hypothetical protein